MGPLATFGLVVLCSYVVLLLALLATRPDGVDLRGTLRLLPDLVRLVGRLARDPAVPRRARAALWALGAYLALPLDLVPDVVPVLGYADDLLAVRIVLRYVVRSAGVEVVAAQWPGRDDGLQMIGRLLGVSIERSAR